MPAIKRNLLIEQGATGTTPSIFTWQQPRDVFRVAAIGGSETSGATEPVWPTSNCDCDQIVDNDVVWACNRKATRSDWDDLSLWCADTVYAVGDEIITPKTPTDITGYEARMEIRTAEADDAASEVLFSMTEVADAEDNYIELGDAAGTIEFVIQADTTAGFDWNDGEYDLELVSPGTPKYPNGFVTRLLKGTIAIDKERTRP